MDIATRRGIYNQQPQVMSAIQTLRQQAKAAGNLNSTPQQTVSTQSQGGQQVIVIQPANSKWAMCRSTTQR